MTTPSGTPPGRLAREPSRWTSCPVSRWSRRWHCWPTAHRRAVAEYGLRRHGRGVLPPHGLEPRVLPSISGWTVGRAVFGIRMTASAGRPGEIIDDGLGGNSATAPRCAAPARRSEMGPAQLRDRHPGCPRRTHHRNGLEAGVQRLNDNGSADVPVAATIKSTSPHTEDERKPLDGHD